MDRDDLLDLFSEFGPVVLRRMFSGFGIVADGVNFAMALRIGLIFRVDDVTVPRYDEEGAKPFQYETRNKTIVVKSYRHIPDRLYDDPAELAVWAREAVGAAKRAAARKPAKKKRSGKSTAAAAETSPSAVKTNKAKATRPTRKKQPSRVSGRKRATAKRRQAT